MNALKTLSDDSVDSLVTDPPAGISFMGKEWDGDKGGRKEWIAWMSEVMRECLRVMKPGAHGLVWAIPRTSHWTATALEDAGFEVRDVVTHLFGQGFPKSLDISKAIDKAAGAEREVIAKCGSDGVKRKPRSMNPGGGKVQAVQSVTAPSTELAKKWQGWGTALKPASEHWILVRKPCSEKTVAANTLKHGTGGINIDGSRIETDWSTDPTRRGWQGRNLSHDDGSAPFVDHNKELSQPNPLGRFPANLVLSHSEHCTDDQCDIECAIKALDEQSGYLHGSGNKNLRDGGVDNGMFGNGIKRPPRVFGICDRVGGGASRFFYCAKISKGERGEGNKHPTVKPQKLMRYLIKLVTPPGGTVLDPFAGSGSTGVAAVSEGFRFLGIEREKEYAAIAEKRTAHAQA